MWDDHQIWHPTVCLGILYFAGEKHGVVSSL